MYGNVAYGLLAQVAESVTQDDFARVLQDLVLNPLHIEGYLGAEPPRAPMKLADVRSRHAGTDIEPYNSRYYRALALPWSQLVTTPKGALNLVRAYAGVPRDFLSDALRQEAVSNQTNDLPGGYGGPFDASAARAAHRVQRRTTQAWTSLASTARQARCSGSTAAVTTRPA